MSAQNPIFNRLNLLLGEETMEVGKQNSILLIGEFDDGVLVEGDASSDAVIIRWQ